MMVSVIFCHFMLLRLFNDCRVCRMKLISFCKVEFYQYCLALLETDYNKSLVGLANIDKMN